MDKKTMLKVFGDAFLRSMIVLMAVAIVGFGVFFVIRVNTDNKDNKQAASTELSDDELQAMIEEDNAMNMQDATTQEATTEEVTTEEVTTEELTTEAPDIPSTDKNICILNSTTTTGLAGSWATKLNSAGFSNIAVGNYAAATEETTKIYVAEEGMGNDLIGYFNGATLSVGSVDSSVYSVKSGTMDHYDIYIVIGNSDTSVQ